MISCLLSGKSYLKSDFKVESAVDSITDWKAHLMRSRNQEDARLDLVRDLKDRQISQDSPITSSLIKDTVADLHTLIPDIQEIHIYSDNAGCYKNTLMMASLRRDAIDARQNGQFIVIVVDTVTVIDGEKNNMKSIPGITQLHNFQFVSDGLRADFLEEHRRVLESRLQPVIREITDIRARTREELESLYRKIVSVVLLRSGLGSPTYIAVVREATADLQSVYPQTELGTFMSLTKRDKERQLLELTMIVTGIRLFNKECGKGGEEINDYLMEKMHFGESSEGPSTQLLKESLINTRQHEAFLRVILNDVFSCAYQVESLEKQLATRMEQLQATVQSKWLCLQLKFILEPFTRVGIHQVSVLINILASLEPFTRGHRELFTDEILTPFLDGAIIKSDEQRIQESKGEKINPSDFKDLDWLFPDTTKHFNKLPLQYRGYCAWALAKFDRLLLPSNPDIGVLRNKDHYYGFSNKQAATEFSQNPDGFIRLVAEGAKRSPELKQLLKLHTQFASITPYSQRSYNTDQDRFLHKCTTVNFQARTEAHEPVNQSLPSPVFTSSHSLLDCNSYWYKEVATIRRIKRTNFKEDLNSAYDADRDFIVSFTDAHIIEMVLEYFGMERIHSNQTRHIPPEFITDEGKKTWIYLKIG
ncbi:Cilia- and flagella-associated protein 206 [Mytilus edulis]|uniref:Cilia- and flagella-associated protein 206 n=1 Tax=Mytilus edulis TaxID=6550 RepID=A0A8S3TJB6_MYTED|nr:Cilia- and flagella-associated protein 206 [Mytilus edulis]